MDELMNAACASVDWNRYVHDVNLKFNGTLPDRVRTILDREYYEAISSVSNIQTGAYVVSMLTTKQLSSRLNRHTNDDILIVCHKQGDVCTLKSLITGNVTMLDDTNLYLIKDTRYGHATCTLIETIDVCMRSWV